MPRRRPKRLPASGLRCLKAARGASAKISGFCRERPIHPVLQGEVLIMAVDSDFVLNQVKKRLIRRHLSGKKASAILGKPVSVRFALKNRLSRLGDDPMDALVQFGQQHSDIFTIK